MILICKFLDREQGGNPASVALGGDAAVAARARQMASSAEIYIVDDDPRVRDALALVFAFNGYDVRTFADGGSCLLAARTQSPACVILDIYMPGRTGLDILGDLNAHGGKIPIFIMSGQGDIRTAIYAIRHGAFDFIEKPFDANTVVARVREGVAACAIRRTIASDLRDVLTPRECEVVERIVVGDTNKEAARNLGISPRTIEIHRAAIMEKLGAKNVADLVRMALRRRNGSDD
jgi:two-component system, LuxR family, response regulator FixJ